MEQLLERLTNILQWKRRSYPVTIQGHITNPDGTYIHQLKELFNLEDVGKYLVWLQSFTGWSNFPNLVAGVNHKLYYSPDNGSTIKTIEFPTSLQSCYTYNDYLQSKLQTNGEYDEEDQAPFEVSADLTTQRIILNVKNENFVVYFNLPQTWRNRLGFDSKQYAYGVHIAENRANIMDTLNIFIEADIAWGWNRKRELTNTIYALVNEKPAGEMIVVKPNPPIKVSLSSTYIDRITLKFITEDGEPITFQDEEFLCNIIMEKV